jgi:Arc/MetJ-type ribon-helix-helix transcriptional regulator
MSPTEASPFVLNPPRRYDHGMTKAAKIAISLPQEQVTQAREAVARGEAASVSSYISAALAAVAPASIPADEEDTLADLVADMIAEDGVPSPEAYAWADEVLGLSTVDRRRTVD